MSATGQPDSSGATPPEPNPGVIPGQPPDPAGVTPPGSPAPTPHTGTGDPPGGGTDGGTAGDPHVPDAGLRTALDSERQRGKELEKELKAIRAQEKARADAEKSELEKLSERAESAESRVRIMERESLARQIANEHGIPQLWHRLSGDDARALRADAGRLRTELGLGEGALDGGVRSTGAPSSATPSMDELIRQGAGR